MTLISSPYTKLYKAVVVTGVVMTTQRVTIAVDSETGQLVLLFNPRMQTWSDQFAWVNGGTHIIGRTPTGRATVIALRLNNENMVEARSMWVEFGWHPPVDEP